jgi:hypothetical protein
MTHFAPLSPSALIRFTLLGALAAGLAGCFGVSAGPCADFCDYVCSCEDGSDTASLSCADCSTIYTDDDAALQDECETALTDRQNADREAGIDCSGDTAAVQ